MAEPEGFREYVLVRQAALLRTARLLTGDWQQAEDLVQTALARVWPRWRRLVARGADPDGPLSCPADDVLRVRVHLTYPDGSAFTVAVATSGCVGASNGRVGRRVSAEVLTQLAALVGHR
jgi:sigma-70-like protein